MSKGKRANLNNDQKQDMKTLYFSGLTLKEVGEKYSLSAAKIYYVLKEMGCELRCSGTRRGFKHTKEFCENLSRIKKGRFVSEESRNKMSESSKCHYNGLNGYGHTKRHPKGYILCYVPDHPFAHKDGYAMLHKVLMEIHIGRYLTEKEVVHHINGIRDDNSLDNLELMTAHDHMSMHTKKRNQKGGDLYELYHNNR